MAMTLQQAIDYAANPMPPPPYGITVDIVISMHDEDLNVFVGYAGGDAAMYRPDLPLLNLGVATIGAPPTIRRVQLVPGFSTRGLNPAGGAGARMSQGAGVNEILIDFSVRRDPGSRLLALIGRGDPSVQIEIETWSGPPPTGTRSGGIKLEAAEDGELLRAVGPSLKNPARNASYTATIWVHPTIP